MVNAVSQQAPQSGQKIILVLVLCAFIAMFAGSFAYRMQGAGLVVEVRQQSEGMGKGGMASVMGMDMGAMRAIMDKLRADPENPQVMMEVGNAFMMMQAWDKALEMFNMAEKKLPKDASVQRGLGMVHFERKEFDLAKKAFDKVLAAEPKDALSHLTWAFCSSTT